MALDASFGLGLDISGVDILRTKKGPVIIEVNSQPGLEGITKATGIDVAQKIVEYVEYRVDLQKKGIPFFLRSLDSSQEG